jgi:hypothetical protein
MYVLKEAAQIRLGDRDHSRKPCERLFLARKSAVPKHVREHREQDSRRAPMPHRVATVVLRPLLPDHVHDGANVSGREIMLRVDPVEHVHPLSARLQDYNALSGRDPHAAGLLGNPACRVKHENRPAPADCGIERRDHHARGLTGA